MTTMNTYDGDKKVVILKSGTAMNLYWSKALRCYVTNPDEYKEQLSDECRAALAREEYLMALEGRGI